jgi:hypothetical protein
VARPGNACADDKTRPPLFRRPNDGVDRPSRNAKRHQYLRRTRQAVPYQTLCRPLSKRKRANDVAFPPSLGGCRVSQRTTPICAIALFCGRTRCSSPSPKARANWWACQQPWPDPCECAIDTEHRQEPDDAGRAICVTLPAAAVVGPPTHRALEPVTKTPRIAVGTRAHGARLDDFGPG